MDLRPRALLGAAGRTALGALAAAWLALCWRTTRWRIERDPAVEPALATGAGLLVAVWHGRLAFSAFAAPPGRQTFAMISANRDGDVIGAAVGMMGVSLIRGSSADPGKPSKDKRGRAAAAGAIRAARGGGIVAIAVDGPRGPRLRVKPGVASIAAAAPAAIVPLAISMRRARRARSWDGFLTPRPFDRGVILVGAPLQPPAAPGAAPLEALRLAVEERLTTLTRRADALAGRAPEPPPDAFADGPRGGPAS